MEPIKRKKCKHCNKLFIPDARNANRQRFCSEPECRKASKADSQRRWLNKPENRDYFSGPTNVARVQRWRKAHPGFWRKKRQPVNQVLQDPLSPQHAVITGKRLEIAPSALQDPLTVQDPVLIGLISNFTGSALQDDIASTLGRLQQLGTDIINAFPSTERRPP